MLIDRNVIADCLKQIGYPNIAKSVKNESSEKLLKSYVRLVEINQYKLSRMLNEIYNGK
jgi:hypothetical protein